MLFILTLKFGKVYNILASFLGICIRDILFNGLHFIDIPVYSYCVILVDNFVVRGRVSALCSVCLCSGQACADYVQTILDTTRAKNIMSEELAKVSSLIAEYTKSMLYVLHTKSQSSTIQIFEHTEHVLHPVLDTNIVECRNNNTKSECVICLLFKHNSYVHLPSNHGKDYTSKALNQVFQFTTLSLIQACSTCISALCMPTVL